MSTSSRSTSGHHHLPVSGSWADLRATFDSVMSKIFVFSRSHSDFIAQIDIPSDVSYAHIPYDQEDHLVCFVKTSEHLASYESTTRGLPDFTKDTCVFSGYAISNGYVHEWRLADVRAVYATRRIAPGVRHCDIRSYVGVTCIGMSTSPLACADLHNTVNDCREIDNIHYTIDNVYFLMKDGANSLSGIHYTPNE